MTIETLIPVCTLLSCTEVFVLTKGRRTRNSLACFDYRVNKIDGKVPIILKYNNNRVEFIYLVSASLLHTGNRCTLCFFRTKSFRKKRQSYICANF